MYYKYFPQIVAQSQIKSNQFGKRSISNFEPNQLIINT